MRAPIVPLAPAAALLAAHAAAAGLAVSGPAVADAPLWALVALVASLLAAAVAYALGRVVGRDPVEGWAPSAGGALTLLAIVAIVALLAEFRVGLLVLVPLAAGYFAGRGSAHASDAALGAVLFPLVYGIPWHRVAWNDAPLYWMPALVAGAALVGREAWDLAVLREAAGDDDETRAAARGELARVGALCAAGVALAWSLGVLREGLEGWVSATGPSLVRNLALAGFVATVGGLAWFLTRPARSS